MKKIVVIGSTNTDMVISTQRIPRPGETILGGDFFTALGGKGANQAVAAARAGGDVTFVSKVGNDHYGTEAISNFKADHIITEHIFIDESAPSGIAMINVDAEGNNAITVASGANMNLLPEHIDSIEAVISSADFLLLQLETPVSTITRAIEIACDNDVSAILNPAPAQQLDDALLEKLHIITPNETETEILTGIAVTDDTSLKKAADYLLAKGIEHVLITLGERGVYIADSFDAFLLPAFTVKAIDTTAAGDVFNGALVVALADNLPLIEAAKFASAASALSVTKKGAQPSAPRRHEIEAFLKNT